MNRHFHFLSFLAEKLIFKKNNPSFMRFTIFCICIFITFSSFAQTTDEKLQQLAKHDSTLWVTFQKGDYNKALLMAKEYVKLSEKFFGTADSNYVNSKYWLALVHKNMGHYKEAEDQFKALIPLQKEVYGQANVWYFSSVVTLATIFTETGRYQEAEKVYLEYLPEMKKTLGEGHTTYHSTVFSLAALYYYWGKYEASIPVYQEVIDLWAEHQGKDSYWYATGINSLASSYQKMGRLEEAQLLVEEARTIYAKSLGTEHPYYAGAVSNLALLYSRQEKWQQAERLYLEAINILEKTVGPKHENYLQSLNNLANVYSRLNQKDKAEEYLRKVIAIREADQGRNNSRYAMALDALGLHYLEYKDYILAKSIFEDAKNIRAKVLGEDAPPYAVSLERLGLVAEKLKDWEEAEQYYLDAIGIHRLSMGNQHLFQARNYNALSRLYQKKGADSLALDAAQKAIAINYRKTPEEIRQLNIKNLDLEAWPYQSAQVLFASLHWLEQLYYKKGAQEDALALNKKSLELSRKVLQSFKEDRNKLELLKNSFHFIVSGVEMALAQNNAEQLAYAFQLAEENKSLLLRESLQNERLQSFGMLPEDLLQKEIKLQKKQEKLEKIQLETEDSVAAQNALVELNQLDTEIDSFSQVLKTKYPDYYELKYLQKKVAVENIQETLDEETLLLEFFISDSITYLFALSNQELKSYSIPLKREELNIRVGKFRAGLVNYEEIIKKPQTAYNRYVDQAYWFYQQLLEKTLKDFPNKDQLIIITDGQLGHLPFEAFLTAPAEGKALAELPYLLYQYKVSYHYAAQLHYQQMNAEVKPSNGLLLACAASYKGDSIAESRSPILDAKFRHSPKLRNLRDALNELPAATAEIQALEEKLKGDFWYEDQVNEKRFKAEAGNYGMIHLAMHGILNSDHPVLSSLAFTEEGDSTEDNFLQAFEISRMQLNAQLVVLSACETGYGKFEQGEGIVSLARAFMYAGTPSVVVSLWQVNDLSTSVLMQRFYHHLAQGKSKAAALQQAKIDYIKRAQHQAAHPAFWAAFIQLGDPRPINVASKTSVYWYWGAAAVVTLLLLVLIWRIRRKK
jgi:CHAT domain-containing protein/tetratricopeptide (TPR) repeat protein